MALYKALNSNFLSQWDSHIGALSDPWVVDEWKEIEGPLHWDPNRNASRNGLVCSDDILWAMMPEWCRYIAEVEVDGESIIHGKTQMWARTRITSLKAWTAAKATLVLDWAEGQCHDWWASYWPTEAGVYDSAHYTGQWNDMLEVVAPLWRSLFTNNETIPEHSLHLTLGVHKLLPDFTPAKESIVRLAYALALCYTGHLSLYGGAGFVKKADVARPGTWETVRGFAADHWNSLPEV